MQPRVEADDEVVGAGFRGDAQDNESSVPIVRSISPVNVLIKGQMSALNALMSALKEPHRFSHCA